MSKRNASENPYRNLPHHRPAMDKPEWKRADEAPANRAIDRDLAEFNRASAAYSQAATPRAAKKAARYAAAAADRLHRATGLREFVAEAAAYRAKSR